MNCDTLSRIILSPVNQMCADSLEVTASPCVNVPQQVKFSTIDVPVCNDLVDLSCEVNQGRRETTTGPGTK